MYGLDYGDKFPSEGGWSYDDGQTLGLLYNRYLKDFNIFHCPSDKGSNPTATANAAPPDLTGSSYAYCRGINSYYTFILSSVDDSTLVVVSDRGVNSGTLNSSTNHGIDGVNALYLAGRVAWIAAGRGGVLPALTAPARIGIVPDEPDNPNYYQVQRWNSLKDCP